MASVASAATLSSTIHFARVWSGSKFESGYKKRGLGEIEVRDETGALFANAYVTYSWTGCTIETGSGFTDSLGVLKFVTKKTPACGRGGRANCFFELTATGLSVATPPPDYDPALDVDTFHSAICTVE